MNLDPTTLLAFKNAWNGAISASDRLRELAPAVDGLSGETSPEALEGFRTAGPGPGDRRRSAPGADRASAERSDGYRGDDRHGGHIGWGDLRVHLRAEVGGRREARTRDLRVANAALSQLS